MYQPQPYVKRPDPETMARCWELLEEASKRWDVPMACITSHMREGNIPKARRWLQLEMLALGLKRNQVAWAFGLDVRRVRYSEIGGPMPKNGPPPGSANRRGVWAKRKGKEV